MLEAVGKVVAVANGRVVFDGARISVYWEADETMLQIFSSGNIVEGSLTMEYLNTVDTANAITGNIIDATNNYEKTAMTWIYPDSDPRKATSVELIGVTSPERGMRAIQYKLNKTNLVKIGYSFQATTGSIVCQQGDIAGIEDEFVVFGVGGGRIKDVNESTRKVTLDRIYEEITGSKYLTVNASDSNILYPSAVANWGITNWDNTGDTTVVTISTTTDLEHISELDTFLIGIGSEICRKIVVDTIDINSDFTSTISAYGYVSFSSFDSGLFTLTTTQLKTMNKELFSPRNITFTADPALTFIRVAWDAPPISQETKSDQMFPVLRYMVWRRQGTVQPWQLVCDSIDASPYDDYVALGSTYYYKVLPVFSYYGSEATIPMSWVCNFTDTVPAEPDPADYTSGNIDVANGINFTWDAYEYLPKPELSSATETNGYVVNDNKENESLCDITIFVENPTNWLRKDSSEGLGLWTRGSSSSSTDWIGPTNITTSASIVAGASTIAVNTVTGLCIPGLIIIDDIDLVYVASESSNTLAITFTDLDRKFSVGDSHASGVSVRNAHLGFNPVRYFCLEPHVTISAPSKQLLASTVYEYDVLANSISSGDWGNMVSYGLENFRVVQGISNTVHYIEQASDKSLTILDDIPEVSDFIITSSYLDASGTPNNVYAILWDFKLAELKVNGNGEIYFTVQGIPKSPYFWFGLTRFAFPYNIELAPTFGWSSVVSVEGV
ncbi:MAG: hypothetical protein DRI57_27895 [Deltaproteobacteria bacterium]|nr:MAG: hypothetical protein DRI57_27895 [Deltaproteobacteria bacterium]